MNCPNCQSRGSELLTEDKGYQKGCRKCTLCESVYSHDGKLVKVGKEVLVEVPGKFGAF